MVFLRLDFGLRLNSTRLLDQRAWPFVHMSVVLMEARRGRQTTWSWSHRCYESLDLSAGGGVWGTWVL